MAVDKITIPFPRPTQNVFRGYANKMAEKLPEARPTTIRFRDEERFQIDKVAHSLNMSFGEFVRWCAHYGAIAAAEEQHKQTFEGVVQKPAIDLTGYE